MKKTIPGILAALCLLAACGQDSPPAAAPEAAQPAPATS